MSLREVKHDGRDSANGSSGAGVANLPSDPPDSNPANYGRKAFPAWRGAREIVASTIRDVLAANRGARAEWCRKLNVSDTVTAKWTSVDDVKAPEVPDLLLMPRPVAIELLRALIVELREDEKVSLSSVLALAQKVVVEGASLLSTTIDAIRDGVLDNDERARLHAHGARVIALGEALQAAAKKGAR